MRNGNQDGGNPEENEKSPKDAKHTKRNHHPGNPQHQRWHSATRRGRHIKLAKTNSNHTPSMTIH